MKTTRKNLPSFKDTKAKKLFLTDEDKFKGLLKSFSAGYTRVSNELLFTAMNEKLPITGFKALLAACRLTQGYGKNAAPISYGYLSAILGTKYSSNISISVQNLIEKGYLKKNESKKTRVNTYSLSEKAKKVSSFEVETEFSLNPKSRIDHFRNGKTSINNQFLLDLFHCSASASQVRLALSMLRFSLGMQKVHSEVERSVLKKFSNLSSQSFNKALEELKPLGLLEITEQNKLISIKVPKKYTGFVLEKLDEKPTKAKRITLKAKTSTLEEGKAHSKPKSNVKSLESFSKARLEKKYGKKNLSEAADFVKENGSFSNKPVSLPYMYLESGTTMERVLKEIQERKDAEKRKAESERQAKISAQITQKSIEERASKLETTLKMEKRVSSFLKFLTEKEKKALSPEYEAQSPFCQKLGLSSVLESYLLEPLYKAVLENPLFEKELLTRKSKAKKKSEKKQKTKPGLNLESKSNLQKEKSEEVRNLILPKAEPISLKNKISSMTKVEKTNILKPRSGEFGYDSPMYNALLEKKLEALEEKRKTSQKLLSSFFEKKESLQERKEKMLLQAERMIAMGF